MAPGSIRPYRLDQTIIDEGRKLMTQPNFYITHDNYNTIVGSGLWRIQDLPPKRAAQIRPFLDNVDSFAVFASGLAPSELQSVHSGQAAGIDWVRLESSRRPGEPPLNVYHYVIGNPDEHGYPVYGPYHKGSIAPHWSDLTDLDAY